MHAIGEMSFISGIVDSVSIVNKKIKVMVIDTKARMSDSDHNSEDGNNHNVHVGSEKVKIGVEDMKKDKNFCS